MGRTVYTFRLDDAVVTMEIYYAPDPDLTKLIQVMADSVKAAGGTAIRTDHQPTETPL